MHKARHWTLGAKLTLVATPFLLLALVTVAVTLWVSWQLEGGAAAVNEAGRMRMQAYRMSLAISTGQPERLAELGDKFAQSMETLRTGDAERPLFMPWDDTVRAQFVSVQQGWTQYRARWIAAPPPPLDRLQPDTAAFVDRIDAMVHGIELHMSRWTALLHLAQLFTMALAVVGTAVLVYTGYLFVLEPVGQIKNALLRLQQGDLAARVSSSSTDEFGMLADGFNDMARQVQTVHRSLEARVAEKTAELQEKRERLEALYNVASLVASANSLQQLTAGFVQRLRPIAKADGVALRWSDETNERFLMLASDGLPIDMTEAEHCVHAGECHCGSLDAQPGLRVIPIHSMAPGRMQHCARAGFETIVSIPIRLHERLMGEVDLFFHAHVGVSDSDRSLLEALTAHLAAAMETFRLAAQQKEAAVSQERSFLARELHDSIAQSLAFLKIQVQLMQDALARDNLQQARAVLDEINVGVRESYADVRELLVHFRTRTNTEDIEPALETTLRKFELQSGVAATLQMEGHGMPLDPDLQVQVLHILQEALSNVRKHATASKVWLDVQQAPRWRFEIRDNGRGFSDAPGAHDETHVGLRIMRERAERIGAQLDIHSVPGRGSSVILVLPDPRQAHQHTPQPVLEHGSAA
ncbi:MAG: type IV pili methyl-accepting chemotaxis transducer N-terminal domain-containing protein [Rhodoferax sp.]|jgi:two-component system, NarL family, nitrate/nitrite sensor histidine kinase NarX|nr:type IV pili methyl-accepting chemotaxis transducer N-terminal domain-containing protein [Rhodoferax sp.]